MRFPADQPASEMSLAGRRDETTRWRRLGARRTEGLLRAARLALLVLAVLGADLPEVHAHDAETPGVYNEECPLARLAVPGWGLPALARETLPQADPVLEPAFPPAAVQPVRTARSAFAPRAPPAIS